MPLGSWRMTMLTKVTGRSLPFAGLLTMLTTLSAAALPSGISASVSFPAGNIQYVARQSVANGSTCDTGYGGAFTCNSSAWGRCDDEYLGVFPCRARRNGF